MAYRVDTDTQKHTHTDRQKVKNEGPKILSNDIFYIKTVIVIICITTSNPTFNAALRWLHYGLLQYGNG